MLSIVQESLKGIYELPIEKFDGSFETFVGADVEVVREIVEKYL